MTSSKAPSQRQLRAGELIRHALAEILLRGEVGDPELDRFGVGVHEVTMSPDLRIATAFVRPLVDGQNEKALKLLAKHARYMRGLLAPRLDMKFMPELRFRIDTALDYADKIDRLLKDPVVARDLPEKK
ncbi:30S ribosome-binding factor RbfA [Nordella sp. HKS 07]|uniref:30S ribosome-binding factor RbfA n=1 Tax=Nordella sp. HKS 07 TaxID=2712222 RepID=UPI0013E2043A|nr:30S ribosome-binding factor RbfA [Nordella sp. HKS 07]QIG47288.1 30S ribosome-binding factor RbfA [Nordella sp. HKS 07]